MMTCRELIDFIMEYLDGELPQEQRSVFEEHLKLCPPCLEYLESYGERLPQALASERQRIAQELKEAS